MKTRLKFPLIALALLVLLLTHNQQLSTALAQGTAFTYQGQLQNNGSPASGTYNLTFTLFNTNTGGIAIAGSVTNSAVVITNGLFTVTIDFGSSVWNGQTNWLEIGVETNNATSFTTLAPRQQLTPTPYAIYAENANGLSGTVSASQLTSIGNSNDGSGNFFVGPSGNNTTSGFANTANGAGALSSNTSGSFNTANGANALYNNTSGIDNTADGGDALLHNMNGSYNTANGQSALLVNLGGSYNTAVGYGALLELGTDFGSPGGTNNIALGSYAGSAFTGNESSNIDIGNIGVVGESGVIRIGSGQAQTFIAGVLNGNGNGLTNVSAAQLTSIGNTSGSGNFFVGPAGNATTSGGVDTANGEQALHKNTYGSFNTADGGDALYDNTNGSYNTANGADALLYNTSGSDNTANGYQTLFSSTTGSFNVANGVSALLSNTSGSYNTADGCNALLLLGYNGAGGTNNIALGYSAGDAFTGNESSNIDIGNIGVAGESGVIRIGTPGVQTATYLAGSVGIGTTSAGELMQIGSKTNQADSIIRLACGNGSEARIWDIGVPYGGTTVNGTNYSFIIKDASAGAVRLMVDWMTGDVCIGTNTPLGPLTVGTAYCTGTTWQNGSDRNSKEDFSPVSSEEILAKVAALPITEWQYKVDAPGVEHLGPMAQDFHAAFGLNGGDDKHISTVDEGGVALAAIQGLNQKLETENAELKRENNSLAKRLDDLEAEMRSLAQKN